MPKFKIYLDTSVISAYFDSRKPRRQIITQKWFQNELRRFVPYVSTLVLDEIGAHSNTGIRQAMLQFVDKQGIRLLEITEEIIATAAAYRGNIIPKEINDSIHLAAASCYKLDAVVSWNFKHMVNLGTIKAVHEFNRLNRLSPVEIVSIENLGGDRYGGV